jgi:hypothetical protein
MNIDPLSKRVQAKVGIAGQVHMATHSCNELVTALRRVFIEQSGTHAEAAQAIAGVEIMCAQLRPIVDHAQVDLEAVDRLHQLQGWLADLENNDMEKQR